MKSLEQRLFDAYQRGYGLLLTSAEICSLVADDAIGTRITNQAAIELGIDQPSGDHTGVPRQESWASFKKRLKEECS